jgi:hypothetical protein
MDRACPWLVCSAWLVLGGCGSAPVVGVDAGAMDGGSTGTDSGVAPSLPEADHAGVIARGWCANAFLCDCDTIHDDEAACVRTHVDILDRQSATYRAMGLVYDDACPAAIVREIQLSGCLGYRPVELGCAQCALYHGDVAQGEPCTDVGVRATPCARGLRCLSATPGASPTCEDPCLVLRRFVGPGEPCDAAGTVVCDPLGASCSGGVCEAFPAPGETCDRGLCDRSSYCDRSTDLCVAARPRGEACTNGIECETRSCSEGICGSFCGPRPF